MVAQVQETIERVQLAGGNWATLDYAAGKAIIELTQGQVTAVDLECVEAVSGYRWYAYRDNFTFYVNTNVRSSATKCGKTTLRLRNLLCSARPGCLVDHKDGDGLNNRLDNLRSATAGQQAANRRRFKNNTSGYTGVTWYSGASKWVVQVGKRGPGSTVGYYATLEKAVAARNAAALTKWGEFSPQYRALLAEAR